MVYMPKSKMFSSLVAILSGRRCFGLRPGSGRNPKEAGFRVCSHPADRG